jgi:hypothetical protein
MNRAPILRRGERRAFHKWRWFKERRSGFDRRQRAVLPGGADAVQ